jgi:hypothetical protein
VSPQKHAQRINLAVITETFTEKKLAVVNQNVQDALKNSRAPKIKNMRRHRNK